MCLKKIIPQWNIFLFVGNIYYLIIEKIFKPHRKKSYIAQFLGSHSYDIL